MATDLSGYADRIKALGEPAALLVLARLNDRLDRLRLEQTRREMDRETFDSLVATVERLERLDRGEGTDEDHEFLNRLNGLNGFDDDEWER